MQTRFLAVPLLGAVTAIMSVLVLLVTPAYGQYQGDNVQYNTVCQNVIGAIGDITQSQTGTATAIATDEEEAAGTADASATASATASAATEQEREAVGAAESSAATERDVMAVVAQEQGITIAQVNECLNGAAGTDDDTGDANGDNEGNDIAIVVGGTADKNNVLASTIPDQKVLANTGGPALLLPAFGLLLISSVALRNLLRR